MNSIVIDCGASFIKAAKFDKNGIMIKNLSYSTKNQIDLVKADDIDKDLPPILQRTIFSIKRCICELSSEGEEIRFGLCNEMHGFVLTDENLIPQIDYVSWQKELALVDFDEKQSYQNYFEKMIPKDYILRSGMPFKAGLPSGNLLYMFESGMLDNRKLYYFYSLGDFVLAWLSQMHVNCHLTNAAASGMVDMEKKTWNQEMIHVLNAENVIFPSIIDDVQFFEMKWNKRTIHFKCALGDQQAALLGAGIENENQISVNMGTGAQVSRCVERLELSGDCQMRPYFKGCYLKTIPHIPSGRALNVYFNFVKQIITLFGCNDTICDEKIWEVIQEQIIMEEQKNNQESMLDMDMSFFTNAITKHDKGHISKITEDNLNLGCLFYSAYCQMAQNVCQCIDRIANVKQFDELVFSGGVIRKSSLLQKKIVANYQNVEVSIAENETLLGLFKYLQIKS